MLIFCKYLTVTSIEFDNFRVCKGINCQENKEIYVI